MKQTWMAGILILACLMSAGCPSESGRMADLAEKTVESQSEVNSANAKTHDNFVNLNRELQQERNGLRHERQSLNKQFEKLESDRDNLLRLQRSELAWSESFRFLAIVIAAIMPLFLCAYLIWATTRNTSNPEMVNEILIQELVSKRPRLIAGPNLPGPSQQRQRITDESDSKKTTTNRGEE